MYTKKLLRCFWSAKEIIMLMLVFGAIVALFGFIEFQDARSDLDELIRDGRLTQESVAKISVYSPSVIMTMFASLGFGVAFLAQMFNLSLQVNVTRKHLHRAVIVSEILCAVMVTATVIPVQYGVNMLFSKLCTGDYAPLAAKFEDAALTLSKTHLSIGGMIAAVLSGTFAMAVVGSLLAELLTKGRGIVIATTIIGFITCVIGVIIVLAQINSQRGIRVELLESKSSMDGTIVELINGIEVIRICDSVNFETNRFDTKSEFLRNKEMKHHKAMAWYDCLKFINQALFTVLIIGLSTYLATKGIISVGAVLTAYLCFNQLTKPLEELHRIFDEVSECTILAGDFFEMVEIPNDFSYLETKRELNNEVTDEIINIRNLNFYYSEDKDKLILKDFNIDIEKGMYLGIAGPSGCGKSSLIKSICKLEKADGTIILDDTNINNLNRKDISNIIALVPQSPFLIAGTI